MAIRKAISLGVILLLCLSIVIPLTTSTPVNDIISVSFSQNDLDAVKIIDIPDGKKVASVNYIGGSISATPHLQPSLLAYTTDIDDGDLSDIPATKLFDYDILKTGTHQSVRIFVPANCYINNQEIEISSMQFEIRLTDGGSSPLMQPMFSYEYLIITTEQLWNSFNNEFKQWKISTDDKINDVLIVNVSAIVNMSQCWVNGTYGDATNTSGGNHWVVNGEEIRSNYSMFNDTQAKMRNFIRYCYDTYGTRYVLLVGNKDLVPPRIMFTASHSGPGGIWYNYTHAVDMYFGCLDGNWNNNTNALWGENQLDFSWAKTPVWDDIDWGFDATVGRLLISNVTQACNWINRTKAYVASNLDTYLNSAIVACKDPNNNINDSVWHDLEPDFPSNISFVNGQNISQAQWDVMDDYCNGAITGFAGINILYHSGHGGSEAPYQAGNLNNSDRPQFFYSEGCQTVDFGSSTNSRMEQLFRSPSNGGFTCGISNSAYGWFVASTWYSKDMFNNMFFQGEQCFAKANDYSRTAFGHTYHSVCPMLVKGLIFCGDPSLEFNWFDNESEQPEDLFAEMPVNGSEHASVYNEFLNVTVSNQNGSSMNVSYFWSDGTPIDVFYGVPNNTIVTLFLPNYTIPTWLVHDTEYSWYVIVTELHSNVTSPTWHFYTSKAWDILEDGIADYQDASIFVRHFSESGYVPGESPGDINEDGGIDFMDASLFTLHFSEVYG